MGYIQGIFHPPAREEDAAKMTFGNPSFFPSEVKHALAAFKKLPVFIEHNENMVVGHVENTFVDEKGFMRCEMFIDETTKYGKIAMAEVAKGNFKGLSTGYDITRIGRNGPVSLSLSPSLVAHLWGLTTRTHM